MEADIQGISRQGKKAILISVFGVIVPLVAGFILGQTLNIGDQGIIQSIFIGIIIADTAVAITVETLKEMGKLNTPVGEVLLGAAVIDDLIGVLLLALLSSLKSGTGSMPLISLGSSLLKIMMFIIVAYFIWIVLSKTLSKWFSETKRGRKRYAVVSLVVCFLLSFFADFYFGVPDVVGAFVAGLIFSGNTQNEYIQSNVNSISFLFFGPVFFASMGLKADIVNIDGVSIIFTIILTALAIITKVVGCWIGAKLAKFTHKESIRIAYGMVSPGEFALVMANKGISIGVASPVLLPPIIIMVIITTVLSPIMLKYSYKGE